MNRHSKQARLLTGGLIGASSGTTGRRGVGTYDAGDEHWDDVTLLLDGSDPTGNLKSGAATVTNPNSGPTSGVSTTTTDPGSHPYATDFLEFYSDAADKLTITNDANVAFGNDDFTFEAWIYLASGEIGNSPALFDGRSGAGVGPLFYINNTGELRFNLGGDVIIGSTTLSDQTWYHVALTVENNIAKVFLDGNQTGSSWNSTTNSFTPATAFQIGHKAYSGSSVERFHGHMADIRITKGTARYTSNFTPPTKSLPTVLAGTPEATATLRTRGYVGAAPAGEALWTPGDLSFNPHSWIKADEGISNAGDGGTASVNAGWSDTDGTQNGLATKVNSGTTSATYINLPSSTNINTTFALVKGDAAWVSRAYATMFSDATEYEHHGADNSKVISSQYTTVETWRHTRENGEQIDWAGGTNDWGTKTTEWRLYSLQSSANDPWEFDRFGNDRDIANRNFTGQLAELLTFEEELTEAEIEKIEGYLMHKWGLEANLPSLHPYKASAPTAIGPGVGMLTLYDRYVDRISANT